MYPYISGFIQEFGEKTLRVEHIALVCVRVLSLSLLLSLLLSFLLLFPTSLLTPPSALSLSSSKLFFQVWLWTDRATQPSDPCMNHFSLSPDQCLLHLEAKLVRAGDNY